MSFSLSILSKTFLQICKTIIQDSTIHLSLLSLITFYIHFKKKLSNEGNTYFFLWEQTNIYYFVGAISPMVLYMNPPMLAFYGIPLERKYDQNKIKVTPFCVVLECQSILQLTSHVLSLTVSNNKFLLLVKLCIELIMVYQEVMEHGIMC